MKAALALRQTQRLAMTPQLRQALGLLQMSAPELEEAVRAALEANPLLERAEDEPPVRPLREGRPAAPEPGAAGSEGAESQIAATDWESAEPQSGWEADGEAPPGELASQAPADLRAHLREQLALSHLSARDTAIALLIIDSLNEDGYLTDSLEELRQALGGAEAAPEIEEVEAVLHHVQSFDPPGVAARTVGECLRLQLRQLDPATPGRTLALALVSGHLDELARREHAKLCRKLKITPAQLAEASALIHSLNPRPGATAGGGAVDYVMPDVLVSRRGGQWQVEINPVSAPRLRVNSLYAELLHRRRSEPPGDLARRLQEARWLVKSLRMRQQTLLRVATCVVRRQAAFLERGEEAMRPLMLKDVAAELGLHESTISRAVANKYLATPRGTFALQHFFSNELSTAAGGALSATAIRALIRRLLAAENPHAPLSDSRLTRELVSRGIRVARRTVAKYRESMAIPSAHERKRLAARHINDA